MNYSKKKNRTLFTLFLRHLEPLYSDREIRQILFLLFEEYLGWPKFRVLLSLQDAINPEKYALFISALELLKKGQPIQYILKKAWFCGMLLEVDRNVLIPRQETEQLCHLICKDQEMNRFEDLSIFDIGTGTGCIAIELKRNFPFSEISGGDISVKALEVAARNAESLKVKVHLFRFDVLEKESNQSVFNIIVSNPPYVTESEKKDMHPRVTQYEPDLALYVPDHAPLVYYQAISRYALGHLSRPGYLYLEINERFGKEIATLLQEDGFEQIQILTDMNGKDRFVIAELQA